MTIEADIKNYYETLVIDEIVAIAKSRQLDEDDYEDIACVALNNLPPRYYRHSVDMAFYLSPIEQEIMDKNVTKAVEGAVKFVEKHRKS